MSQPTINLVPAGDSTVEPRPGTRAARMRQPLAKQVLHTLAEAVRARRAARAASQAA